jgi:DNA-directed RNA polymerase specialized sigma24 family protein
VFAAEDALSEALLAALSVWPREGLPQNAWAFLLTAARHCIIDLIRHQRVVSESEPTLHLLTVYVGQTVISMGHYALVRHPMVGTTCARRDDAGTPLENDR